MPRFFRPALRICDTLGLAALAAIPAAAAPEAAGAPGAARVWFLWPSNSNVGYDTGAAPMIFANGVPVGAIRGGTDFYRDLAPGTYSFTVEPYGLPTGQAATLTLAPGTQTYLQVLWGPTWERGYVGGRGQMADSFFISPMSRRLAEAYLPTLAYIGPR